MKTILLFDAETQHYRIPLYTYFQKEFAKHGYQLKIVYDCQLNTLQNDFFIGIRYTFKAFNAIIKEHQAETIILFVWLRYWFLLPFMLYNRLKGIKMITWSHGINLQNQDNRLMNQLYYLRQRLAHSLIIFSPEQTKYIRASHKKLFVANNTLNFYDFPSVAESKEEIKEKYGLQGQKVVLCVGRMNTNNRKADYLITGFCDYPIPNTALVLVGPGYTPEQEKKMAEIAHIHYLGPQYDARTIAEIYQMADIFCMPGAIGLAINHAFYYGLPVVTEDVFHGPEGYYLKNERNGFLFQEGNIQDMMHKITTLCTDESLYQSFSQHARETILKEAAVENMCAEFLKAIQYVEKK